MVELQKSLHTKEFSEARHLCLLATNWFHAAMEQMREMPSPTKADLEVAARNFFEKLRRDIDVPRNFPPDQIREAVHMNTVLAEDDIRALDRQLIANEFEPHVQNQTARMLGDVRLSDSDLPADLALEANRLAARALREHMRYFIHQLERPHRVYVPEDEAFLERQQLGHSSSTGVEVVARPTAIEAKTLSATVADFLAAKVKQGVGPSQIEEMSRLFRWLKEEVGSETSLAEIGAAQLRQFKDNLARIDVTLRGRNSLFKDRLTDDPGKQAKSATYGKYLASLKAFFSWCMSEGTIHRDPAASLEFLIPKSEPKNTPEAFSKAELLVLTRTPLYSGYRSLKHLTDVGDCRLREDHWWSAVLLMHTGMRAGELNQLLPGDFCFDDPIPHLKVRREDAEGKKAKTVKNAASIRAVPLHPNLLTLGIREFVERKASRPSERVFSRFRLGPAGKTSDGLTRFWRDFLAKFNLWSPGRGTHVWRHTMVACMRRNGADEAEIGSFVGHSGRTMTSKYGGDAPLERRAALLKFLDYDFDVVEALGGPFDPKVHSIPGKPKKVDHKV